jgi:hypothetical protein
MFGCYEKENRVEIPGQGIVRYFSNAALRKIGAAGLTEINIEKRIPEYDFFDNGMRSDVICIVANGRGLIHYCFDGSSSRFPLRVGNAVFIPTGAIYALKGKMRVFFVSAPQWKMENQRRISVG